MQEGGTHDYSFNNSGVGHQYVERDPGMDDGGYYRNTTSEWSLRCPPPSLALKVYSLCSSFFSLTNGEY